MSCKHVQTREKTKVAEGPSGEDIVETVCANEKCGFLLRTELAVERADGTPHRRSISSSVAPTAAPQVANRSSGINRLTTAAEMAIMAAEQRETSITQVSRDMVKTIIGDCKAHLQEGQHSFLVPPEDNISAAVITATVKELKGLGYKVSRTAEPESGTWITVKWSTRPKSKTTGREPKKKPVRRPRQKKDL